MTNNFGDKSSGMNKKVKHITTLKAFTILEALIVLSLLSILIAFFFGTLNRLGEQTKNEIEVKGELNKWFAFRANLFREFDEADSTKTKKDEVSLFLDENTIVYTVQDENLYRKINQNDQQNMRIPMKGISNEEDKTVFQFNWKNDVLKLTFSNSRSLKNSINSYFTSKEWQKK